MLDVLSRLAAQKGASNATLAYAWLLHKGVTATVVGATKLAHLDQSVAALDVTLTNEEAATLEAPYEPHPVIGHTCLGALLTFIRSTFNRRTCN